MYLFKFLIRPLVLLLLVFFSFSTKAQTTLVAGDILFTSYNAVSSAGAAPDTFSFAVFTPIATNTVIYFTDRGYQGGTTWQASGTTEGTISWTVGAPVSVGSEVEIYGFTARINGVGNGTVAQVAGGNASTGLSLGNVGDQLMAFQGGGGDPTNAGASFKCGISWQLNCGTTTDAGWNGSGCTYGPQSSRMPPGLTGGTNALLAGTAGSSPGYNSHGKFNCIASPPGKAGIMNKANWQFSDNSSTTVFNIPPACNYSILLPLKWINVTASVNAQKKATIHWKVEENEVARYEIEKSTDGRSYTGRGVINSRGDGLNNYQFIEVEDLIGTAYYRIKQVDKNSQYTYSSILRVSNNVAVDVSLYPNPTASIIQVNVSNSLIGTTVELTEITGKKIRAMRISNQSFTVNMIGLNAGIYLLRFVNGQTEKVIVE